MAGEILIAPNYVKDLRGRIIFLAGPIQGAFDWQAAATKYIRELDTKVHIANPRRNIRFDGDFMGEKYAEQVDWETHHLRRAGMDGAILFWLARENNHDCSRAYAQTTRFELAEWKAKHEQYDSRLVVGIEDGFTGAKYILRRFAQDCPDVKVSSTLEETCKEAVRLANARNY